MLLIDDLLLAPFSGLLWVSQKILEAAQEEMDGEADAITEELRQLYLSLESGTISEAEFDAQERRLLDRLDVVQARTAEDESEEEDVADDAEDDAVFGTYEDEDAE
jgi:hypothetical protein